MKLILTYNDKQFEIDNVPISGNPVYGTISIKRPKVKTIAPVDEESFKAAKDFAETYTTQSRMEQGLHVMKSELLLEIEAKNVGAFLKWITGDIFKEEQAAVIQNNLDPKKVAKEITNIARRWYFEQI